MEPEWAKLKACIVDVAARSCDQKVSGACLGGNLPMVDTGKEDTCQAEEGGLSGPLAQGSLE